MDTRDVIYGVKLEELDPRIAKVAERLTINSKDRIKIYGTIKWVANDIFLNEEGKEDLEYLAELRKLFLECEDPTEYTFAVEFCKSWGLYKRIRKDSSILRNNLEEWHKELEIKLRSKALKDIIYKSQNSTSSAKYLFEGKYKEQIEKYVKNKENKNTSDDDLIYSIFENAEEELEKLADKGKLN